MTNIAAYLGLALLCASSPAHAAAGPLNVSPEEHAACDGDASLLCSDAQDVDQLLACMKMHRTDLTPRCATVFSAGLKKRGL